MRFQARSDQSILAPGRSASAAYDVGQAAPAVAVDRGGPAGLCVLDLRQAEPGGPQPGGPRPLHPRGGPLGLGGPGPVQADGGTFQRRAAAFTSISRAAAPVRRIKSWND